MRRIFGAQANRLIGVDIARGLAILAMIAVWFLPQSSSLERDPGSWHAVLDGRVLVLFALIAGIGVGLLSGGRALRPGVEGTQDRLRLMVRAIAVYVVGHAVNVLDVPFANTMSAFGFLIAISLLFLHVRPRTLVLLALGWIALLQPVAVAWSWLGGHDWFRMFSQLGGYVLAGDVTLFKFVPVVLIGLALSRIDLTQPRAVRMIMAAGVVLVLTSSLVALPGSGSLAGVVSGADDRPMLMQPAQKVPEGEDTKKPEMDPGKKSTEPTAEMAKDGETITDLSGKTCVEIPEIFMQCLDSPEQAKKLKTMIVSVMPAQEEEGESASDPQPTPGWTDAWQLQQGWSGYRNIVSEVGVSLGVSLIVLGVALAVGRRASAIAALGAMPLTAYASLALLGKAIGTSHGGWWVLLIAIGALVTSWLWTRFIGRGPLEALVHWTSRRAARIGEEAEGNGRSNDRIIGLDIARGIALLGMVAVHMVTMLPHFSWQPDTWPGVASGRSSILFAVLAGVSMAIMSGRDVPYTGVKLMQARSKILTRALIIFTIGVVLTTFGHPIAIILDFYGIFFILALPFITWRPRHLFIGAGVLALVVPFINFYVRKWAGIAVSDELFGYLFAGVYPAFGWLALMLFGIGLGRLRLGDIAVQRRILAVSLVLVLAGWGFGEWAEHASGAQASQEMMANAKANVAQHNSEQPAVRLTDGEDVHLENWTCAESAPGEIACLNSALSKTIQENDGTLWYTLGTWAPHSGSQFELIGSGGFAALVIALCLLASRKVLWLLQPLAALGTMALTAYVAHVFMLTFWEDRPQGQYTVWLIFVAVLVPVSLLWKHFFGRGPIERWISWMAYRNSTARQKPA